MSQKELLPFSASPEVEEGKAVPIADPWFRERLALSDLDEEFHALDDRLKAISKRPGIDRKLRNSARRQLNHFIGWNDKAGMNIDPSILTPPDKRFEPEDCFRMSRGFLVQAMARIFRLEKSVSDDTVPALLRKP